MPTAGEEWCRIELTRLADGNWAPDAWLTFIRAALDRAALNRGHRRAESAQARRWVATGTVVWLLIRRRRPDGPFAAAGRSGLGWWAAWAVMLDWHIGMLETEAGEPVALNGADALTLTRAWLTPAVAASPTAGLLLLGGLTDIADGRVARATRCTRFGRDLEGTVDAAFTVAALHGAARARSLSRLPLTLERLRLGAGLAYVTNGYLRSALAPDRTITRSGRPATPVRFAALIAAGAGRRRLADGLLVTSTALATRALATRALANRALANRASAIPR